MQFIILIYVFIGVLFVTYLILGIKAFHKYLNEDTGKNVKSENITKE